jgi:protein TonB
MAASRGFPHLRPARFALLITALAICFTGRPSLSAARPEAPDSTTVRSIAASSSVVVEILWTETSPAPFKSKLPSRVAKTTTESTRNLGADGVERWVRALNLETAAQRERASCPKDSTNPSCQVRLTFAAESGPIGVLLNPRKSLASVTKGEKWVGSFSVLDRAEPVRQLLVELFPNSTSLGGVTWCTTPAADTTNRDMVYLEEVPEIVSRDPPMYPVVAREMGVSGTVILQILVGSDGKPKETMVIQSIPMLDPYAVRCVEKWRFKPATSNGKPMAVWVAAPVKFTLK